MQFLIYLATGEERQNTVQIFLQGKLLSRALVLTLWCAESHGSSSDNTEDQAPTQPTSTQSEYLGTIKLVGWWMVNNKSQGLQSGGSCHRNGRWASAGREVVGFRRGLRFRNGSDESQHVHIM